jgi:hypothetical protein
LHRWLRSVPGYRWGLWVTQPPMQGGLRPAGGAFGAIGARAKGGKVRGDLTRREKGLVSLGLARLAEW